MLVMVVSSLKDMTTLIGRVVARFMGMSVGNIHKDRLIISITQWVWMFFYSRSFRKWWHCWRLFVMRCNMAYILWIQNPWCIKWLVSFQCYWDFFKKVIFLFDLKTWVCMLLWKCRNWKRLLKGQYWHLKYALHNFFCQEL